MNTQSNNAYLAGIGASAAMLAAVLTAFLLLTVFVAFHGWPSGSTGGGVKSVEVGSGSNPAAAAGQALSGAPTAAATAPATPSATLLAIAVGAPPPVTTGGGTGGGSGTTPGGGGGAAGGGTSASGSNTGVLAPVSNTVNQTLRTSDDGSLPIITPVAKTVGGLVGLLTGHGPQSGSSPGQGKSTGLLGGLLGSH